MGLNGNLFVKSVFIWIVNHMEQALELFNWEFSTFLLYLFVSSSNSVKDGSIIFQKKLETTEELSGYFSLTDYQRDSYHILIFNATSKRRSGRILHSSFP